ncbi:reverse transcriptase domain-containing protein, partial [Tanacetum coccineum]
MWESAKTIAPTPNYVIIQLDVDDNFVINSTHLNMIRENKFDGYLRADPHDHIREFVAICNMFRYGKTQSEVVKLMIFPLSLCDEAKFWFNELNEKSITSWEQMRKAFINRFFPPSLFNRLLLKIINFSQNTCESLTEAWLRLKNMLRKCHGHGLTKRVIIQIFYHGLDEPTQAILDVTAGGIFIYKSPNQAFQLLEDKVLFNHDWPIKSKNEHQQKSVAFADGSNRNNDKFRLMEKLASLTIKMDSQIISLNEELQDMREKYNELRNGNASKNHLNDDTPMCERHEANYIQSEGNKDRNSHDLFSHQSLHDHNDSEKSLTELNNDVRNDLKDFKRCIHSMRTIHWKLYDSGDCKTTGVLPNKRSTPINQEPQSKTDFEKLMTKFLDGQRVTNMYFKNNVNDIILKMKQNEKNFQTKIKNMERKIDGWSKSQNVSSKQTDRTDPPPPQAHTKHVNAVFTGSGKIDQGVGSTSGIRDCALRNFDLGKMELENSQNNALVPIPVTTPESGPSTALKMTVPSTTEENICKKNDVKARTRFRGNEATKRTQKALLKQQYENFNASITLPKDLNVKFLRSLPSEWHTHMVKKSIANNNDDKNLAFLTTSSLSSTNTINTVNTRVSTGTTNVNIASTETSTASLSDATVYAFLSTQPQRSQLVHEDLEQLHDDDLEEMDLNSSKAVRIKDASEKAMCAIDGSGFDWSDMAEDEIQANMALMAFTDSEVSNDKSCSKTCLQNYEALKKQYDDLLVKLDDTG